MTPFLSCSTGEEHSIVVQLVASLGVVALAMVNSRALAVWIHVKFHLILESLDWLHQWNLEIKSEDLRNLYTALLVKAYFQV